MAKGKKNEKKVVNKQPPKLFSQKELAHLFGISVYQLDSLYSVRGIDRKEKLSLKKAREMFEKIV